MARKILVAASVLAVMGFSLFPAPAARADVTISANSSTIASALGEPTATTGVTATYAGAIGATGFSVAIVAGSQSYKPPTGPFLAQLESTTINLSYTGSGTGTLALDLLATYTNAAGYIYAPGTLLHKFSISSSSADSGTSAVATSYTRDSGGAVVGSTLVGSVTGTADPLNPTISPVGVQSTLVAMPTTGFQLEHEILISMASGTTMQLILTTQLCNVPEPSTMAIAGLGALGLVGYGIRRRRAV